MVRKALLGLSLVIFALSSQASASTMLFKLNNISGSSNTFNGVSFNGNTFWLRLSFTDAAANPNNTVSTSITGGQLYSVPPTPGAWGIDANFDVAGGSVLFGDNQPTFLGNRDFVSFTVNFANTQTLQFGSLFPVGTTSNNSINESNVYKFMRTNGTGVATFADFSSFGGGAGNVTAIPEPGSMAVLGLISCGLGGFAARRRLKKSQVSK